MNFYAILGVPQDASTADIKRAYRRLARRYHPGVNPGDRAAEEMFRADRRGLRNARRSGSAPAVRHGGSARRRRARDRRRSCSRSSIFPPRSADRRRRRSPSCSPTSCIRCRPARRRAPKSGADLHAALTVSFADAVHGVERQVLVTRQVVCGACAGAGQMAIAEAQCRQCQGTGHVRWARGHMVFSKPCAACGGEGRQTRAALRRSVRGRGAACAAKRCSVAVPAGDHRRRAAAGAWRWGTRAGTAAAPAICMSRSTCSRTRGSGAKATTCVWRCRWRCTKPRSARASTCRRSRAGQAARSARHASRAALAGRAAAAS